MKTGEDVWGRLLNNGARLFQEGEKRSPKDAGEKSNGQVNRPDLWPYCPTERVTDEGGETNQR